MSNAQGLVQTGRQGGDTCWWTYSRNPSLMAHSAEEEVARNFICFGKSDAVVVVCDATCLEAQLKPGAPDHGNLGPVLVRVNLLDEAKRKHISVDLNALSDELGVPVAGTVAGRRNPLDRMMDQLDDLVDRETALTPFKVQYDPPDRAGHPHRGARDPARGVRGKVPWADRIRRKPERRQLGRWPRPPRFLPAAIPPAALSPRWLALKLLVTTNP